MVGLYIAYVTPVYLRLRAGDNFTPGAWTLGAKYKWVNTIAVVWVGLCVIIFSLPFTPAAVPWNDEFTWSAVNYSPLMVGGVFILVGLWWILGAKNTLHRAGRQHLLRRGHGHHRGRRADGHAAAGHRHDLA